MSPSRHRWTSVAAALAIGAMLAGCSSSDSQQPTASHSGTRSARPSSEPTESTEATSSPSESQTPTSPRALLSFSPKSGGKHLEDCQRLEPGDDPAQFLYYPVVVTANYSVTLDQVVTEHTQGVVDAQVWVAPAAATPETGTVKGWPPPKIVTGDDNLQWSKRVPAKGAVLDPDVPYNVFLRLQVDPTPGDSEVSGIKFSYLGTEETTGLVYSMVWGAKTTFSMSC
jgi:hypothetical protein